jgi:nuclear pore complex protein Nup50
LTHDNWQDKEQPEEPGVFKKANEEVLKNRPKLTAKRRGIGEAGKTSAFTGFGSLIYIYIYKDRHQFSPFSFLANVTSTSTATSISSANGSAADKTDSSKLNDTKTDDKQDETDQATLDYYAKIKSLNESVSKWIKTHVEADPVCDLTPVFKDYSNHLKKIEEEKDKNSKGSLKTNGKPPSTNCTAVLGNFKFGGDSTLNE